MANTIETYVDYIQHQLPGLKSGDYHLKTKQTLTATGVPQADYASPNLDFSVRSERFQLQPADILGMYPPPHSMGAHSSVLPQIVLGRNTLPWERMLAEPKDDQDTSERALEALPWMALLVFHEDELESPNPKATDAEKTQGKVMSIADFQQAIGANFPNYDPNKQAHYPLLESNEKDTDKLTVIYAQQQLLRKLLPSGESLGQYCHARQSTLRLNLGDAPTDSNLYYELWDTDGRRAHAAYSPVKTGQAKQQIDLRPGHLPPDTYQLKVWIGGKPISVKPEQVKITVNDDFGAQVAIIPANRLPRAGSRSVVHLVSLEKRYQWDGKQYSFFTNRPQPTDLVPLVSLKSWSFHCVNDTHNFTQMLGQLVQGSTVDKTNTLRLPNRTNPTQTPQLAAAIPYLQNGYLPLPHNFRRGGREVSWYRGPLVPGQKTVDDKLRQQLPASSADALLRYDPSYGMLDTSYAAAWELGRLLALKNKSVATSLYRWKRLHRNQLQQMEQREQYPHLPVSPKDNSATDLPKEVAQWFSALSLLKGLPFNYLVPDEQMLPRESLRFFHIDLDWLACLVDGAFSIGRVSPVDATTDQSLHQRHLATRHRQTVSGILVRSYVVKGWPKLQLDAYDQLAATPTAMDAAKLNVLRIDHLAPNVLLCLFEGDAKVIDIHQKPEMLHLGFDLPQAPLEAQQYTKVLRNETGNASGITQSLASPLLDTTTRIVNMEGLFQAVAQQSLGFKDGFTSAQFALAMVEGVQKVRFVRS